MTIQINNEWRLKNTIETDVRVHIEQTYKNYNIYKYTLKFKLKIVEQRFPLQKLKKFI